MKALLTTATFIFALIISSSAAADEDQRGFKGIYIGQSASELPSSLKENSIFYEGVHDGDSFRLTVMKNRVDLIEVIYSGETFSRSSIRKFVTLAQALKEHSLAKSPQPMLALARGKDGNVNGLVDLTNKIRFSTASPTSPDGTCSSVIYLRDTAPVLKVSASSKLTDEQVAILTAAATSNLASPSKVMVTEFEDRYTFSSREAAIPAITNQSDIVIGKGKRVLALINSAEVWLQINEEHTEAINAFRELRKFYSAYEREFKTLIQMHSSNKAILSNNDISLFSDPMSDNEKIKRRMNQISAMGFNRYAIDPL